MAVIAITGCTALLAVSCNNQPKPEQKVAPAMEGNNVPDGGIKIDPALLVSAIDPVCGMSVQESVADTATYDGKLYGFCSEGCKDDFLLEPGKYVK